MLRYTIVDKNLSVKIVVTMDGVEGVFHILRKDSGS